jgi:hypothetical protein
MWASVPEYAWAWPKRPHLAKCIHFAEPQPAEGKSLPLPNAVRVQSTVVGSVELPRNVENHDDRNNSPKELGSPITKGGPPW